MSEPRRLSRALFKLLSKRVLQHPGRLSHFRPSIIHAPSSDQSANDTLIKLLINACQVAASELIENANPALPDTHLFNVFPGERYRLLNGLIRTLNPRRVIEIGTFTGMGSFAIVQGLSGTLHTFDVVPWSDFKSHLHQRHFDSGRVVQHLTDLSDSAAFQVHRQLLNDADLIFLDAPKDGRFEYKIAPLLANLSPRSSRFLVVDDIRFVNMIDWWQAVQSPKLDMTSFGHWSGTGLVDISEGLKFKPD
jgi:predicted O-methyltransferase YrrM